MEEPRLPAEVVSKRQVRDGMDYFGTKHAARGHAISSILPRAVHGNDEIAWDPSPCKATSSEARRALRNAAPRKKSDPEGSLSCAKYRLKK